MKPNPCTLIDRIPPTMLADYMARRITSAEVGAAIGYDPSWIRRTIKRPPQDDSRAKLQAKKRILRAARETYWSQIAHLPVSQIKELASVSISTAARIKKKYAP